jgi:hypothetical protein
MVPPPVQVRVHPFTVPGPPQLALPQQPEILEHSRLEPCTLASNNPADKRTSERVKRPIAKLIFFIGFLLES